MIPVTSGLASESSQWHCWEGEGEERAAPEGATPPGTKIGFKREYHHVIYRWI